MGKLRPDPDASQATPNGLLAVWLLVVVAMAAVMTRYGLQPGIAASAPPRLVGAGEMAAHGGLMIFIHPRCPCSAATLENLARLKARFPELAGQIIVFRPLSEPEFIPYSLRQEVDRIPQMELVEDLEGAMAATFGVKTSGQVLFYGSKGQLVFAGGITQSRGHNGDSDGLRALEAALRNETEDLGRAPVYGCPILEEEE